MDFYSLQLHNLTTSLHIFDAIHLLCVTTLTLTKELRVTILTYAVNTTSKIINEQITIIFITVIHHFLLSYYCWCRLIIHYHELINGFTIHFHELGVICPLQDMSMSTGPLLGDTKLSCLDMYGHVKKTCRGELRGSQDLHFRIHDPICHRATWEKNRLSQMPTVDHQKQV
jgi:hypothetical protein